MSNHADVRTVSPAPPTLASTRDALQTLTTNVLTPARYRATGRIAMQATPGGFGTFPFGDDDRVVRVDGTDLVIQTASEQRRAPITTVGAACEFVLGQAEPDMQWVDDLPLHDPPATAATDDVLEIDEAASRFLGEWFNFAFAVLAALRDDEASVDASDPQLWPEHFDPAIEVLPDKRRASYGFSPGDANTPEPYAYVSVWYADSDEVGGLDGDLWNASGFPGAALRLSEITDLDDQFGQVLDWFRARRDALAR